MNIVEVNITELKPYKDNAKKHPKKQVDLLKKNIEKFGFTTPILIDKDYNVIAGHGRLLAVKELKWTEVPCVLMANLTPEEVKALRLADNRLSELGEWDMGLVIEELQGIDLGLLDLTGFSKDLIITPEEKDDEVPELPQEPVSNYGDLYEIGNHRVLCGDSTNLDNVEKLMSGKKADMVFTDPPYNVDYVGKSKDALRIKSDKMSPQEFIAFTDGYVTNLLLFCSGSIYCCMSSSEWGTIQDSFKRLGGHWSRVIIWVKDRMVLSRADYHTQFEPILVENEEENEEGQPILYGWKDGMKRVWNGDRKQTDIWNVKRPSKNKEHPTMKPVALVVRALLNSSIREMLVLDLFLGGGSTLIAAEKTGRVCYGMELDPKYVDVIVSRYCKYVGNNTIKKNGKEIEWVTNSV